VKGDHKISDGDKFLWETPWSCIHPTIQHVQFFRELHMLCCEGALLHLENNAVLIVNVINVI
jgi:hypothetical protein